LNASGFAHSVADEVGGALVPYVSWPFAGGPITYGPTVALGIRITLGRMRGASRVDWESVTAYGDGSEGPGSDDNL